MTLLCLCRMRAAGRRGRAMYPCCVLCEKEWSTLCTLGVLRCMQVNTCKHPSGAQARRQTRVCPLPRSK